jgi:hypothetical protein
VPAVSHFAEPTQWPNYLRAVVDIAFPTRSICVTPAPLDGAPGLPYPLNSAHTIHIVTAFNPHGRHATARANLRAQHELLRGIGLRGLQWWPAVGGDPVGTHAEISAAVVGMDDAQARALGRQLGQDAVFAWSPARGDCWPAPTRPTTRSSPAGMPASSHHHPTCTPDRLPRSPNDQSRTPRRRPCTRKSHAHELRRLRGPRRCRRRQ